MKKISNDQIKEIEFHLDHVQRVLKEIPSFSETTEKSNFPVDIPGFMLKIIKHKDKFEIIGNSPGLVKYFKVDENFNFEGLVNLIDRKDWRLFNDNLQEVFKTGAALRNDFRFDVPKKDRQLWFEIIMAPDEQDKDKVSFIFLENTERKAIEERERVISEIDKSSSLKSLVSCIAHEVNNPNHNILQNISLLENGWPDIIAVLDEYAAEKGDFKIKNVQYSKIRDYLTNLLTKITNSSRQIKEIIDDLRRFSQKSQDYTSDQINLNHLVEKTVELVRQQINNATENFKVMYSADMIPVLGNYNQLQQVLLNLIHNSINALDNHSDEIKVFTFFNKQENFVGVGVADKGRGMSSDQVKHIFNHFYNIKTGKSGSGLGLPISKEIIDLHNGAISINSRVDEGTTVTFKLPVKARRK